MRGTYSVYCQAGKLSDERWIDLANVEKNFEGLMNWIVREQYLESCPVQVAIFLTERKHKDLSELASFAEQYLDAHANNKEWPRKPMFKGVAEVTELLDWK